MLDSNHNNISTLYYKTALWLPYVLAKLSMYFVGFIDLITVNLFEALIDDILQF